MSLLPGKQLKRKNFSPSQFQAIVSTEPSSCTEKITALLQLLKVYIVAHMVQSSDILELVLGLGLVFFFFFLLLFF